MKAWLIQNLQWFYLGGGVLTLGLLIYTIRKNQHKIPGSNIEPEHPLPYPEDWDK